MDPSLLALDEPGRLSVRKHLPCRLEPFRRRLRETVRDELLEGLKNVRCDAPKRRHRRMDVMVEEVSLGEGRPSRRKLEESGFEE